MMRRIPIADWPDHDRALWEKGVARSGLFEISGAGADWSESTRKKIACGYGRWLAWLAKQDSLAPDARPAERVTRERLAAYFADLRGQCAPYTAYYGVQELYYAMRVVAPGTQWGWLAQLLATLRAQVRPVRDKLSRLQPAGELAALGKRLMDEAEFSPWAGRRGAGQRPTAMGS